MGFFFDEIMVLALKEDKSVEFINSAVELTAIAFP